MLLGTAPDAGKWLRPRPELSQSLHIQLRSRPTAGPTMGPAKFSFFSFLEKGLHVKLAVLCNSIVYFGSGLKVNNSREDGNRIICFCIWVQVGAKCCFCYWSWSLYRAVGVFASYGQNSDSESPQCKIRVSRAPWQVLLRSQYEFAVQVDVYARGRQGSPLTTRLVTAPMCGVPKGQWLAGNLSGTYLRFSYSGQRTLKLKCMVANLKPTSSNLS